jgi:predicted nuclease with TOPRIM domain
MADDRSERRREFDRMTARHRAEIERQRAELQRERKALDERMARLRAEMEAARDEFARAAGVEALSLARKYRDRFGEWPVLKGRRRRRRGFDGGEPAPVKPRPKPTPLVDGAEAPIE